MTSSTYLYSNKSRATTNHSARVAFTALYKVRCLPLIIILDMVSSFNKAGDFLELHFLIIILRPKTTKGMAAWSYLLTQLKQFHVEKSKGFATHITWQYSFYLPNRRHCNQCPPGSFTNSSPKRQGKLALVNFMILIKNKIEWTVATTIVFSFKYFPFS